MWFKKLINIRKSSRRLEKIYNYKKHKSNCKQHCEAKKLLVKNSGRKRLQSASVQKGVGEERNL